MPVMSMDKVLELKLCAPLYSTFHVQGTGGAVMYNNPTIRNWYYNETVNLRCTRRFLNGYSSPELTVPKSLWNEIPHLEQRWYGMEFLKGYVNVVIRELLAQRYYVNFGGVDDYYVKGKSWYKKRHFNHDGLIHGYNQNDKTFRIYAYDESFIYRSFDTGQRHFNEGRKAMFDKGTYGYICGIKPKDEKVMIEPVRIYNGIKEYLNSSFDIFPMDEEGEVYGIVVLDYLIMYITMLLNGTVPYEKMDWRIFRLLWEHESVMKERIRLVSGMFRMHTSLAGNYTDIVKEADTIRILYASYHMKKRDHLLHTILEKLNFIRAEEERILTQFTELLGGVLKI